jgi:TonB family protein
VIALYEIGELRTDEVARLLDLTPGVVRSIARDARRPVLPWALAATEPRFEPLTEAELLLRTEQTVAVACPALTEDDWLVVAVTLIEQRAVTEQGEALGKLHAIKDPGVTKPRIVNKVEPAYPEAARKNQVSGHVVLEVVLDRDGIPRAPTVASMSPGCEELAAAAVEAVLRWRYAPAMLHGRPVPVLFTVTVHFKLA